MVHVHEILHLINDDKSLQPDDEHYLLQRRETFGSVEKLDNSISAEEEGGILMNLHPTVSRLSKILNLASSGA